MLRPVKGDVDYRLYIGFGLGYMYRVCVYIHTYGHMKTCREIKGLGFLQHWELAAHNMLPSTLMWRFLRVGPLCFIARV